MSLTAWDFDNNGDSIDTSEPVAPVVTRRSTLTKPPNAFAFEDQDDQSNLSHSSSRRKHMHRTVVVMEEDGDDDDRVTKDQKELSPSLKDQDKNSSSSSAASFRPVKTTSSKGKSDELVEPLLVEKVLKTTSRAAAAAVSSTSCMGNQEDAFVHELVREFLKMQGHLDVLEALDEEMPMDHLRLEEKQLKSFHHKVVARKVRKLAEEEQQETTGNGLFQTRLEQFIISWNLTVHERELPSRRYHRKHKKQVQVAEAEDASATTCATTSSSTTSKKSSSKVRVKPTLTIDTKAQEVTESTQETEEEGFNRIGCPGHTPKATNEGANDFLYGEPGHTPKARTDDLIAQGLADAGQDISGPFPPENLSTKSTTTTTPQPSIMRRRSSISIPFKTEQDASEAQGDDSSNKRRVQIGDEGNTPKKEYFFYRETPPQFVTETVEAAKEIFEKLAHDPAYNTPPPTERYVELSSGEVSKYKIGQEVKGLGVHRDVNGIVAKLYGSRQCGSSGPGTIVIDTCPPPSEVKPSISTTASTSGKNISLSCESDALFDAADEELMAQLLH